MGAYVFDASVGTQGIVAKTGTPGASPFHLGLSFLLDAYGATVPVRANPTSTGPGDEPLVGRSKLMRSNVEATRSEVAGSIFNC